MYKQIAKPDGSVNPDVVQRLADGATIPNDEQNADWRDYLAWVAAGNTVQSLPGPTVDELIAYAAAKRYAVETGGTSSQLLGRVLTDRSTQNFVTSTIASIDLGIVSAPIRFKGPGGFFAVDRAMLVTIGTVIAAHVQAAFNQEEIVCSAIGAGTITTTAQIDAAAWPSNT